MKDKLRSSHPAPHSLSPSFVRAVQDTEKAPLEAHDQSADGSKDMPIPVEEENEDRQREEPRRWTTKRLVDIVRPPDRFGVLKSFGRRSTQNCKKVSRR
jgi:hypothetical protein